MTLLKFHFEHILAVNASGGENTVTVGPSKGNNASAPKIFEKKKKY